MVTAAVIAFASVAFAQSNGEQAPANQTFFVLDNPNDPMSNQLLGVNDQQIIVGYFGDGMAIANNGYWIASNDCLPRLTAARMASADLVQTNGLGLSLVSVMKRLMAA